MSDFDVTGLNELAADIKHAADDVVRQAYPLVKQHAEALRDQWRKNARKTAGKHGRHYPRAITMSQLPETDAIVWEVGPERGLKQGSMGAGFEYGSVHQPPHLDGTRAFIAEEPKFVADVDKLLKDFL